MAPGFDVKPVVCRFPATAFLDLGGGEITFAVTPLNEWGRKGKAISTRWKMPV